MLDGVHEERDSTAISLTVFYSPSVDELSGSVTSTAVGLLIIRMLPSHRLLLCHPVGPGVW